MNAMSEPVKENRAYHSPIRAERARANRVAVLAAAHRRFLADGYAATPIAAIAREAGVSQDLVYKLFKTKHGLLVEVLNFAVTGESNSPRVLEQEGPQAVRRETDQRRQLAMFAEDIAGRVSRARPVDDVMRSAGDVDPEIAAKQASMHRTRLRNLTALVEWLAANGPLRDGLEADQAATTVWVLCSPDVHRMLTDGLGWDHSAYAAWLHRTLEAALLPPPESG